MDEDKYAPRVDGTKQEKTGARPSEYSIWHRKLGQEYLAVDIDYVEYRRGKGIVALIDVTGEMEDESHMINSKKFIWKRTPIQREVLANISRSLKVPAYFVLHTKDLQLFHVHDLSKNIEEFRSMTVTEYEKFIKNL